MFEITIKAYSRIGIATLCQLRAPGSIPSEVSNFYTISSVIGITTTISDNISCMWSKVDNFSCYFSTNSRENFPTNLLLFRTREISKGVVIHPPKSHTLTAQELRKVGTTFDALHSRYLK